MPEVTASTSHSIRDALEDDIVSGKLAPGTKLDEARLCQRFELSRTPIREALRCLAERGMVELIRNRGAFVAKLSMPRLIEMFEVMAELEGMCGRLAARRIDQTTASRLRSSHESCRKASRRGNTNDYYYRNEAFHDVIYEACQNQFLIEQVGQLRRRLQPYRRLQLQVPRRMKESLGEHQAIVNAILAGDEQAAELRLKQHVLIQGERFNDFVALLGDQCRRDQLLVVAE